MIKQYRDALDGRTYYLETDKPVGGGGEAFVYRVKDDATRLAKVYHRPSSDASAKLAFMLANPPGNPTATRGHQAYAWPTALITPPRSNSVVGFLMPNVTGMKEVFDFYNPGQRRKTCARFNYRYLMQSARNIAGIMHELHSKGYVVGDVNQRNILVSDAAMVTVLDTDSFQCRDPKTGHLYLCRVRSDGFIAPEAYLRGTKDCERTVEQDLFGLAVLIFHLLMEGIHPFAAKYLGDGDPPYAQQQQSIIAGVFPYANRSGQFAPVPTAPPFEMLNPEIRALFLRCFVDGHETPTARPTAKEWQRALATASKDLVECPANKHHYYDRHLGDVCPWCARAKKIKFDSFPPITQVGPPPPPPPPPPPRRSAGARTRNTLFTTLGTSSKTEPGKRAAIIVFLLVAIVMILLALID
jgi:DNA-binding helix-hairpin-helix protein with protein kinase domain